MKRNMLHFQPQSDTALTIYMASSTRKDLPIMLAYMIRFILDIRDSFKGAVPNIEYDNTNMDLIRSLRWSQRRKYKSYVSCTVEFLEEEDMDEFLEEIMNLDGF